MKCQKCGSELYENIENCVLCGYSEVKSDRLAEKEEQKYVHFVNPKINNLFLKIFGNTEKIIAIKYLKYLGGLFFLLIFIYSIFFYVDITDGCFVKIRASFEFSNLTIKKGIRYLKKDFPDEYNRFCKNVKVINPAVIGCGQSFGGGCFYPNNPKEIVIMTELGKYKNAAHVIIHETCHVVQQVEKRPFDEAECYKRGDVINYER